MGLTEPWRSCLFCATTSGSISLGRKSVLQRRENVIAFPTVRAGQVLGFVLQTIGHAVQGVRAV
eukprot:6525872-Alexandrium_andersonii.AAC.1